MHHAVIRFAFPIAALVWTAGCGPRQNTTENSKLEQISNRADCESVGGSWEKAGIARVEICIRPYADAGKACRDSDDCEGDCLFFDGSIPVGSEEDVRAAADLRWQTPPWSDVSGTCQRTDSQFGCRSIVEDGKLQPGICVD